MPRLASAHKATRRRPAPIGPHAPAWAYTAPPAATTLPGMVYGISLRSFVVNGLSAMAFFLLMKSLVGPHLPAGAQKLIAAA